MSELPKVVYVGATDVAVKVRKRLDVQTHIGEFSEDVTEIVLRTKQSAASLRDTLVHELLHAIIYIGGLRKSLDLTYDGEEALVGALAPWLLAALRDNPKLVEFLLENREREF